MNQNKGVLERIFKNKDFIEAIKIVNEVFVENGIKEYWTLSIEYRHHLSGESILQWTIYSSVDGILFCSRDTLGKTLTLLQKKIDVFKEQRSERNGQSG